MCWFWALSAPSGERRISLSQICYYLAFSSAPWRLRSRLFRALSPGSCSDSVGLGFLWGFSWKPLSPDQLPLIWLDWDLKLCPQRWVAVDVPLASCCVLWNSAHAHRASPGWRAVSAPAVPFALTILGPGFRPPAAVEATASRQLARCLPLWSRVVPVHFELLWLLPRAIEQVQEDFCPEFIIIISRGLIQDTLTPCKQNQNT